MHESDSGQARGTNGSPQITLEQSEYAEKIAEAEAKVKEHQDYLKNDLPKTSPLKIPRSAKIKEEHKPDYDQVKYLWKNGEYFYQSRWHNRTPNAPKEQGDSWVVERRIPGIGSGPNARMKKEEILVGRTASGKNKWVDKRIWDAAIYARKHGVCTQKQKELLDNGHWKA